MKKHRNETRKKWSKKELAILRKYYPSGESLECFKYLNGRTMQAIKVKARRIGLSSDKFNVWTDKEIKNLPFHWKKSTMDELLNAFPNRTYNSIMHKAGQMGIKTENHDRKRIGSLDFLNTLNPKSCYWWGFIMADGHITKSGNLIVSLQIKDKDHLEKLSDILGCKIHERKTINGFTGKDFYTCGISIGDMLWGKKWLKILNINSPKTYTPPDLSVFLTKENLIYFFIGLVDGDGCIWESRGWLSLKIVLHHNWLDTLMLMALKLKEFYDIDSKVKLNKRGNAFMDINTIKDLKIFGSYIHETNFLERKWDILIKNFKRKNIY